jgi:hypothetical protein
MKRSLLLLLLLTRPACGAILSSDGINSDGLKLDGTGVWLGQIEDDRSGKAGFDPTMFVPGTVPEEVYFSEVNAGHAAGPDSFVSNHATEVAEQMIGTAGYSPGVAPQAKLISVGVPDMSYNDDSTALAAAQLATIHNKAVKTISISFARDLDQSFQAMDGSSLIAQAIDWNASNNDTLFTIFWGNDNNFTNRSPSDSFNGIKVGGSQPEPGFSAYQDFWTGNSSPATNGTPLRLNDGDHTWIEILAPAYQIPTVRFNASPANTKVDGTSFAAPMVAGAVALMRQHAQQQFDAGNPRFAVSSQRHEVIKAAVLNAADKIGGVNGATYSACGDVGGSTCRDYTQGDAYGANKAYSLDSELGSGLLNTKRAVNQLGAGKYSSSEGIYPIGWDYNTIGGDGDSVEYNFAKGLSKDKYLTATLVWDRITNDTGSTQGVWEYGEGFTPYGSISDVLNDLDLYLETANGTIIAASQTVEDNVEQIFFPISSSGNYKLVVHHSTDSLGSSQNYALAWWFGNSFSNPHAVLGDYNDDGTVDSSDYQVWKTNFGSSVNLAADGNGDGFVNAADYTIWRDNLGHHAGSAAAVPEPSLLLCGIATTLIGVSRRAKTGGRCVRLFAICESQCPC